MSHSGLENIRQFPLSEVMRERLAAQKIAAAQSFDELFVAINEAGTFKGSLKTYTAEEVTYSLALLLSQLRAYQSLNNELMFDLTEFTSALGLRQAIGRLLVADGFRVHPNVFAEPEPPAAG